LDKSNIFKSTKGVNIRSSDLIVVGLCLNPLSEILVVLKPQSLPVIYFEKTKFDPNYLSTNKTPIYHQISYLLLCAFALE